MRFLICVVLLSACTVNRYEAKPPQNVAAPKPTPNRARAIAASLESSDTKCVLWTGRETPYGGVDSMMCVGPAQLIYVRAPDDNAPEVKITLQTESPPSPPKETAKPPAPAPPAPKPEPKKK